MWEDIDPREINKELNLPDEDGDKDLWQRALPPRRPFLKEVWGQTYFKQFASQLGIEEVEGPFDTGPDFRGIYDGKRMWIEVERHWENFIEHGHDPRQVGLLVLMSPEEPPEDQKDRLPPRILHMDYWDVVRQTHDDRKDIALQFSKRRYYAFKKWDVIMRLQSIVHAFQTIWMLYACPDCSEFANEDCAMAFYFNSEKGTWTVEDSQCPYGWKIDFPALAFQFLADHGVSPDDLEPDEAGRVRMTDPEFLANLLVKSRLTTEYTSQLNDLCLEYLTPWRLTEFLLPE